MQYFDTIELLDSREEGKKNGENWILDVGVRGERQVDTTFLSKYTQRLTS